jgi:hypothetical protein
MVLRLVNALTRRPVSQPKREHHKSERNPSGFSVMHMRRFHEAEVVIVRLTLFSLTLLGSVRIVAVAFSEVLQVLDQLR